MYQYNPYTNQFYDDGIPYGQTPKKTLRRTDSVAGFKGAQEYHLDPGEDVFLRDANNNSIGYFKMADGAGNCVVKGFKMIPLPDKSTSSIDEKLDAIVKRLDKLERRSEYNGRQKYQRDAQEPSKQGRSDSPCPVSDEHPPEQSESTGSN